MVIQVRSAGFEAGNYAKITINGKEIKCEKNSRGHYRGLHFVVIDLKNFKVIIAKVFDTYKDSYGLDFFLEN